MKIMIEKQEDGKCVWMIRYEEKGGFFLAGTSESLHDCLDTLRGGFDNNDRCTLSADRFKVGPDSHDDIYGAPKKGKTFKKGDSCQD